MADEMGLRLPSGWPVQTVVGQAITALTDPPSDIAFQARLLLIPYLRLVECHSKAPKGKASSARLATPRVRIAKTFVRNDRGSRLQSLNLVFERIQNPKLRFHAGLLEPIQGLGRRVRLIIVLSFWKSG